MAFAQLTRMLGRLGSIYFLAVILLGCGKDAAETKISSSSEALLTGTISGNPAEIFSVSLLVNGSLVQDELTTIELSNGDLVNCRVDASLVSGGQIRKYLIVIPKHSAMTSFSLEVPDEGIQGEEVFTSLPALAQCRAEIHVNGINVASRMGTQRMLYPSMIGQEEGQFPGIPRGVRR